MILVEMTNIKEHLWNFERFIIFQTVITQSSHVIERNITSAQAIYIYTDRCMGVGEALDAGVGYITNLGAAPLQIPEGGI